MLRFSYEAVDATGSTSHGELDASDLSDALRKLESQSLEVRSLRQLELNQTASSDAQTAFRQRLNALLTQRNEWVPALHAMVEEMPSGRAKQETAKLVRRMEQDFELDGFLKSPQMPAMLPLLASGGEAAGSTTRLRDWLSELVRAEEALARRRSLLIYPAILLVTTAAILIAMSFLLIPIFRDMYEEFGLELPAPTLWLFWAADQISTYLPRTVLTALLIVLAVIPLLRVWRRKALTNRILGSLAAGRAGNLQSMSTLTSTLAELIALRCPLSDALKLAGRACNNFYYERATDDLSKAVLQGNSLAQFEHRTRLPPSVIRAMFVGENQSPNLSLLRELATVYSDRSRSRTNFGIEGLPALGIAVLGLLVGFVVVALFMPLVTMVSSLA